MKNQKENIKQPKKLKNQKTYMIVVCVLGMLLVVAIALLIAVLVQQGKNNQDYNRSDAGSSSQSIERRRNDRNSNSETSELNTNKPANSEDYISSGRAIDIALEKVGATRENVRELDVDLDYEFGQKVYEVTFDYNNYEYEYYIDPTSGEIVKSFKEIDH